MKEIFFGRELNNGKHCIVFGSNHSGIHGAGAARHALIDWGAIMMQGCGRQGMSYAIPTKDGHIETLPLDQIKPHVDVFVQYATDHPELTFLVTRIGCGLAGYSDDQISPMFKDAPQNCVLPEGWRK